MMARWIIAIIPKTVFLLPLGADFLQSKVISHAKSSTPAYYRILLDIKRRIFATLITRMQISGSSHGLAMNQTHPTLAHA